MTKKSERHIPFTVFAILLIAIVGFHLQQKSSGDQVLGMSTTPVFSKEWFAEILSFFGLGSKTERTAVEYSLPESDKMLMELEETSDDGGQSEFDSLEKEASAL